MAGNVGNDRNLRLSQTRYNRLPVGNLKAKLHSNLSRAVLKNQIHFTDFSSYGV